MAARQFSILLLVCLVIASSVQAAPPRRHRSGLVAPNQQSVERKVETASVSADNTLSQVRLEASPGTTFIGSPFPMGLSLDAPVPAGQELVIRATGNGKDVAVATIGENAKSATFTITPTGDNNGVYTIYFEIDTHSAKAAKGYKAPPPLTIPVQENSQILLFRSSQDTGLDVRGGSFDYIFTNQTLFIDVYLGVPVPITAKGNLTLVIECDDGFKGTLDFPPGSIFRSFNFSTLEQSGNFTMHFSVSGVSSEFYLPPPDFQFVAMNFIQISLLGTETELYINDTIPIEGILSAPLPFGESLRLALVASNNKIKYMDWASRSFDSGAIFEAGAVPGIYRMYFSLDNYEFYLTNSYITPTPFYFVVFNRTRLYQITVESSPSSLFSGTYFPFTVNLHSPVPEGKELNVIATGSDGKTYTLVFYAGETNKTFECYPSKTGPFTIIFSVEGSAAEKYSPPPLIGFEVFPPGEGVTLLDTETELMVGETLSIEVSLGVPVPIGTNLTVSYVATNGQTGSVTFAGLEVAKNMDFYAGDVSGTYLAEWHLSGSAKHYYAPPPVYGFAVLAQNYMGHFGAKR